MDDFTAILNSPLMKGIPTAIVIGLIAWGLTEALTSWMAEKYRPAIAVLFGVLMGYLTHRADLVDFGGGPNGWLAAMVFGAVGGALAPLSHPFLQNKWPFSMLTKLTPSGRAATAASTQGGTGS